MSQKSLNIFLKSLESIIFINFISNNKYQLINNFFLKKDHWLLKRKIELQRLSY